MQAFLFRNWVKVSVLRVHAKFHPTFVWEQSILDMIDADPLGFRGSRPPRHETWRVPTWIPTWPSVFLLELLKTFLFPHSTSREPSHTSAHLSPPIAHPTFWTWRRPLTGGLLQPTYIVSIQQKNPPHVTAVSAGSNLITHAGIAAGIAAGVGRAFSLVCLSVCMSAL